MQVFRITSSTTFIFFLVDIMYLPYVNIAANLRKSSKSLTLRQVPYMHHGSIWDHIRVNKWVDSET